jgi:hypothetical protein
MAKLGDSVCLVIYACNNFFCMRLFYFTAKIKFDVAYTTAFEDQPIRCNLIYSDGACETAATSQRNKCILRCGSGDKTKECK